jgi:hypothetical protein
MYKINAIAEEFEVIEEYEGDDSHVEHKIVVKVLEHKQIEADKYCAGCVMKGVTRGERV